MRAEHRAPPVVLLGPQRFSPTLGSVLGSLGIHGEIAVVTAGWQEREDEDTELRDHLAPLGLRMVNLMLHRRGEEVFAADPTLRASHHFRQERLKQLQSVYRMRFNHAKNAAREVLGSQGDRWLLEPERDDALEAIRRLDTHHLARVAEVYGAFEDSVRPHERPPVARQREEVARLLQGASALAIAGGHVSVLLNRLRLFGVLEASAHLPVVAWSAGAMACCDRIVLFHDSPPQGEGSTEILGPGLGRIPSVIALPHASRRLKLDDPLRISFLARRFEPAACVALDPQARVDWRGGTLDAGPGTRRLTPVGGLEEMARA